MKETKNSNLIDVLATGGASHIAGCHQPDAKGFVARLLALWDLGGIKVRRVVLVQHFSFRHFSLWASLCNT
jgi:hypothetical protein